MAPTCNSEGTAQVLLHREHRVHLHVRGGRRGAGRGGRQLPPPSSLPPPRCTAAAAGAAGRPAKAATSYGGSFGNGTVGRCRPGTAGAVDGQMQQLSAGPAPPAEMAPLQQPAALRHPPKHPPLTPRSNLLAKRGAARTIQSFFRRKVWSRILSSVGKTSPVFRSQERRFRPLVDRSGKVAGVRGPSGRWYVGHSFCCLSPVGPVRTLFITLIEAAWFVTESHTMHMHMCTHMHMLHNRERTRGSHDMHAYVYTLAPPHMCTLARGAEAHARMHVHPPVCTCISPKRCQMR